MSTQSNFEIVPLTLVMGKGLVSENNFCRPVVLLVEEDQVVCETRAKILSSWGFTPVIARTAERALSLARNVIPELLVCEASFPKMNGIELAIEIARLAPDCEIVLFAGPGDDDNLALARHEGNNFSVLNKPVHPSTLFRQLRQFNFSLPN